MLASPVKSIQCMRDDEADSEELMSVEDEEDPSDELALDDPVHIKREHGRASGEDLSLSSV